MAESLIGIKIANGELFPILEEGRAGKKRVVLTTVNNNQAKVQIDLYKGRGKKLSGAVLLGSLTIENIKPSEEGEPEIELIISLDDEGSLNAEASYQESGERQDLNVRLNMTPGGEATENPEDGDFNIDMEFGEDSRDLSEGDSSPDFSGDFSDEDFETGFETSDAGEGEFSTETFGETEKEKKARIFRIFGEKRRFLPYLLLIIGVLLLVFGIIYFVSLRRASPPAEGPAAVQEAPPVPPPVSPPETQAAPPAPAAQPVVPVSPPPAVQPSPPPPAVQAQPPAPAVPVAPPPPAAPSQGGEWYLIKRGDTLWDLSNAFYRTPWQYQRIARANNIADPNRIYWGFRIFIPE
ncbi:MAG: LysM peptidoglycan-binding domain-containing protein [Spirochaetales bacterium]|nr:LysM peptidoglycan-binding domain-containing protein [Spirochaetales bacterium]